MHHRAPEAVDFVMKMRPAATAVKPRAVGPSEAHADVVATLASEASAAAAGKCRLPRCERLPPQREVALVVELAVDVAVRLGPIAISVERVHGQVDARGTVLERQHLLSSRCAFCFKPDVTCEEVGGRGLSPTRRGGVVVVACVTCYSYGRVGRAT